MARYLVDGQVSIDMSLEYLNEPIYIMYDIWHNEHANSILQQLIALRRDVYDFRLYRFELESSSISIVV